MKEKYDLVVIGTGFAGSRVAFKCREAGMEVAIIDSRPFGGTCALRGCNPKRVLTGAAELVGWCSRMAGKGGPSLGAVSTVARPFPEQKAPSGAKTVPEPEATPEAKGAAIDWPALLEFKETFTEPVPKKMEERFLEKGIDTYKGIAHFSNESTIAVASEKLTALFIVIATGARQRKLNIAGEEYLTSSEEFMKTPKLPKDIAFIGGSNISFELANVAAKAGSNAIIVHKSEQPLEGFDPQLVNLLVRACKESGIEIYTKTEVIGIEKGGNYLLVKTNNKMFETILTQMAVHGAGHAPELEALDLERGGVKTEQGRVAVNKYLQSISNPRVYAAGDCIKISPSLTSVAQMEGDIVASNIVEGNVHEVDYTGTPRVVFTDPSLASVGMIAENQAGSNAHEVAFRDKSEWYSARRINMKYAASKIIIDRESDRISGAHLLGPNAEEIINIFALAMRLNLTASQLKSVIYSYPSACSDIECMY